MLRLNHALVIALSLLLFTFSNSAGAQCGAVTIQNNYYGEDCHGYLSGNTEVCGSDINFFLNIPYKSGFSNVDELIVDIIVIGDFGVDWQNLTINPLDHAIPAFGLSASGAYELSAQNIYQAPITIQNYSNCLAYSDITSTGGIDCRISYRWKDDQGNWRTFYTDEKFFTTNISLTANMLLNQNNAVNNHGGTGELHGFTLDGSASTGCGITAHTISFQTIDINGNSTSSSWTSASYNSAALPTNTKLKDVANSINLSWQPGDNYKVRFGVHNSNNFNYDYTNIYLHGSESDAFLTEFNGSFKDKFVSTPYGNTHYRYFENTDVFGNPNNITILVDGHLSTYTENQSVVVQEIEPSTWQLQGSPAASGWIWSVPQYPSIVTLNTGPFFNPNVQFTDYTFYLVTHAVAPNWNAEYLLMQVGPYEPVNEEPNEEKSLTSEYNNPTPIERFIVYPTVTNNGQFNVRNDSDEIAEVFVLNQLGQEISTFVVNDRSTEKVKIESPSSGIYYLKFTTASSIETKRIVVR